MYEITLTTENFQNEVLKSEVPVMVDFWAAWCGPCKMVAPIIEEIAKEYTGKVKVGKINVDEQPELASAFRITSIPTIMIFKNGKIKETVVGYQSKERLIQLLK